jgi:F-type H+-transporting ATPase subunit c
VEKNFIKKEKFMNAAAAFALSGPLGVGFAALGSGIGIGLAVASAITAIGRQPEASGKILTNMIIGAALIESLTIYALIVFFVVLGRTGG